MPLTYEDLTFCCEIQAIASLKYLSVSWETTLPRLRLVVMFPNNCCSIAPYVCWNCSTLWGCAKKGKKNFKELSWAQLTERNVQRAWNTFSSEGLEKLHNEIQNSAQILAYWTTFPFYLDHAAGKFTQMCIHCYEWTCKCIQIQHTHKAHVCAYTHCYLSYTLWRSVGTRICCSSLAQPNNWSMVSLAIISIFSASMPEPPC